MSMNVTMLRGFSMISLLALSVSAAAQDIDESALDALDKAGPVTVQQVREPAGAVELRAAMRRIAYSPTDADALADAGNAALTLGDANAALNFFTRANALRPNNGRIVSGLATATVRTENPFEALRLFDDAVRLGISDRSIAADRALAYDLLGNFARAQQDYKLARLASTSDDLRIRHAISTSLAGQRAEADAMLVPLLQKDNIAAWRARAFMLAARGDFRESTKVTQGFMDKASAQRMERYLRLMPDLTGAQQAAAIHLGHFPASQNVGRDSDQVRRVASNIPPVEPSKSESRLIPTGDPLGPKTTKTESKKDERKSSGKRDRKAQDREEIRAAVANIPESNRLPKTDNSRLGTATARAAIEQARTAKIAMAQGVTLPPPESARPLVTVATETKNTTLPATQPIPGFSAEIAPAGLPAKTFEQPPSIAVVSPPAATQTGTLVTATSLSTGQVIQGPTPSGAPVAEVALAAQVAPASVQAAPIPAQQNPTPAFDLAAIVSAIKIPESEQKPSAVPVNLKTIRPSLPKLAAVETTGKNAKIDPKAAAKAKAEAANPARHWVQIATGASSALSFDYRKWSKKTPALFKGHDGWTSPWGKATRLLVGPFADMKAAKKWEGDFKKAGGDGFIWQSEKGVAVSQLKSK